MGLRNHIGSQAQANQTATLGTIPRQEIENHFIHLDDGVYHDEGRYWSNANDVD